MASYLDEFLNKPRDPVNPFDLDKYISNYPGKDRIQELQNIDYTNNPRDTATGTASDFRHSAAMNELSKSLSPGFVPDFVGDSLAYGLGAINEIPDAFRGFSFREGFDPQSMADAKEDFSANYAGSFGTPNTATIEDVFAKTLGYQAPGTNIQTASAIGNPMGYGAAQASDLTDLERDFPGMSTGDIIDSMNNKQRANRFSGMGQVGPNKSNMNAPAALDMDRFAGVSNLGRNDMDVEQVESLTSPQGILQGLRSKIGSGFNNVKDGITGSSTMDFLRGLPTPGNLLMNMAATRNPLNPRASNYNPTLQGQVDFMKDQGMYGTNPNSGLGQITGGRLAGKNLVSGFGTNDLGGMYSKDLSKLEGYLTTMPQRFSRLMKNNPTSYQNKIDNLNKKIAQNKREAEQAQAAREAATAARAMARNPQVYANAGITSGGFASQNTGTNSNFSNNTGRGRTGYQEGGLASMFTRRR